jgi:hypothetical protein
VSDDAPKVFGLDGKPVPQPDNVEVLSVDTTLDLPLDRILDGAREHGVTHCLLLGYDRDGEFYTASQITDVGNLLILLERAKVRLLGYVRPPIKY